ncbi:LytR/AlgR family response regulator transcription factor [Fibrella forsythiae]|uniref:Response regulator transcription factor n=1 Tax=Fibrella forsythiae TaxID=2817061 RepID=A0ABS3JRY5_9BACT|nr:LytTR family DNA-binding domain-containing protein [Fibrella forsythiae]MBO0952764.1 response regulator transcription factor [Fibrella forsythiae]
MTILLLEDDPIWRLNLRMIAEQFTNSTIVELATYDEALVYLEHNQPDIVVSDVSLNKQISFNLFQSDNRTYPVIFITGYANHEFLQEALQLPNSSFLVKPFHDYSLVALIENMLNQPRQSFKPMVKGLTVVGKHRQKIVLPYSTVVHVEAQGNYTMIHLVDRKYLLKRALKSVLSQLDLRFVQIHKTYIINKDFINRIDLSESRVNVNGVHFPIGRMYRKELLNNINE